MLLILFINTYVSYLLIPMKIKQYFGSGNHCINYMTSFSFSVDLVCNYHMRVDFLNYYMQLPRSIFMMHVHSALYLHETSNDSSNNEEIQDKFYFILHCTRQLLNAFGVFGLHCIWPAPKEIVNNLLRIFTDFGQAGCPSGN